MRAAPQPQDAIGFILRLGRALHTYGYAAHRLEAVLSEASTRLGLIGQFFSTPTSIFASFGSQEDQRTFLLRVEPGDVDLGKLAALDRTILAVARGEMSPAAGSRRVDQIVAAPPRYGPVATVLAFGLASAAACRFLGGGLREIGVAAVIGVIIGLMAGAIGGVPQLGRVFEPVAALIASSLAAAAGIVIGPYSVYTATLAGLIVLIPGLTLTVAIAELGTRQLASGTARLSGAFMVFLALAFGVALGSRLTEAIVGPPAAAAPIPLPGWTVVAALVVAPLAFTVLFRAEPRDAGWILGSGVLAVLGGRLGTHLLGLELGVFVGSLVVGVASNLFARFEDRPNSITQVPGIILLVPGSIGYRSLASLLEREVVVGVETAFTMILTAVALAAGLLIADIVAPERRIG